MFFEILQLIEIITKSWIRDKLPNGPESINDRDESEHD